MGFLEKLLKKKAKESAPFCSVVVVAAGQASRMEGIDKILCPMERPSSSMPLRPSRPLIWWMRSSSSPGRI